MRFFRRAFLNADYQADAALVRRYAAVELTRQTFDTYASKFTLSSVLGTARQIERDYHCYGIPRSVGDGEILARILRLLENEGIQLPSGPGTPLGQKIGQALAAGLSADQWISIPASYMLEGPNAGKMRRTCLWLAGVEPTSCELTQ